MKSAIQKELRKYASAERIGKSEYFFKTDEGGYSADDKFIGVRMPHVRLVAKQFFKATFSDIKHLLHSEIHEDRLCALVILSERAKKAKPLELERIVMFYIKHKKQVNNWDLVDLSAHYILGQYILDNPKERYILDTLVSSQNIWDRRIAMVSTWVMNRAGYIDETLYLAEKLLEDQEDLIHKAVGWMLREAWKKDSERVESFLKKHYERLPRTTLRYAIEKIEPIKRKRFLTNSFGN